jgi:ESCRT-II complex subunit VPS22
MRRNVGLSSLERQANSLESYSSLSTAISQSQLAALSSQLQVFQSALRAFATKHRRRIISDPVFRGQFADMCSQLGVDPLGGGRKGIWDHVGIGEWTYGLAVQVVDVCLAAKERKGGLIEMGELIRGVSRLRGEESEDRALTPSDVARAIRALEPLGCGYSVIDVAGRQMVRCVPAEFDTDALIVVECGAALQKGWVDERDVASWTKARMSWTEERSRVALNKALMGDGLVWIDEQAEGGSKEYWIPSLWDFDVRDGSSLETAVYVLSRRYSESTLIRITG